MFSYAAVNRSTKPVDEEAQHGPQHGSVRYARLNENSHGNGAEGALISLVLCPIFGVLSCTVWKGTTAGTVVLTIAIVFYAFGIIYMWGHPGMTKDLDTEALSESELDAIVAKVNGARVGVCVHVRCSHSFYELQSFETPDNDGGTRTAFSRELVTEVSFCQTNILEYGKCVDAPQSTKSVDMGGFGMCVVYLDVACDTNALTLGLKEAKEKAISDNSHRDQDCSAKHCCMLLCLWGETWGGGHNKEWKNRVQSNNDSESAVLFFCSDAQKKRIQRMRPWMLLSTLTGTIGLLYCWFGFYDNTGEVVLDFKKFLYPCRPSQNQQTQEPSQETVSEVWKNVVCEAYNQTFKLFPSPRRDGAVQMVAPPAPPVKESESESDSGSGSGSKGI